MENLRSRLPFFILILATLLLYFLFSNYSGETEPMIFDYSTDGDSGVVSATISADGETVDVSTEELSELLDTIRSVEFFRCSLKEARQPGWQHTQVQLIFRNGTKQNLTFPNYVDGRKGYCAEPECIGLLYYFFPVGTFKSSLQELSEGIFMYTGISQKGFYAKKEDGISIEFDSLVEISKLDLKCGDSIHITYQIFTTENWLPCDPYYVAYNVQKAEKN